MNPPFHDKALPASPDPRRRGAHSLEAANLADWVAAAQRLLRPGGILTLIFRADGVPVLLDLLAGGFGAIALLPVHPKPGAAAIRVLLAAIKASRGPLAILPGLVLAEADGTPTAAGRGGAASRRRVGAHRALIVASQRSGCSRRALGVLVGRARKHPWKKHDYAIYGDQKRQLDHHCEPLHHPESQSGRTLIRQAFPLVRTSPGTVKIA